MYRRLFLIIKRALPFIFPGTPLPHIPHHTSLLLKHGVEQLAPHMGVPQMGRGPRRPEVARRGECMCTHKDGRVDNTASQRHPWARGID